MIRSTIIKLYPTKDQASRIDSQLGNGRFVWNYYLNLWNRHYKIFGKCSDFERLGAFRCANHLTKLKKREQYSFLQTSHRHALVDSLQKLEVAFKDFWKRGYGYPKFHSRKSAESMKYDHRYLKLEHNKVWLPKVGWMKYRGKLLEGQLRNGIVIGRSFGSYEMSLVYEVPDQQRDIVDTVGIDINCHNLTLSDGRKFRIDGRFFEDKIKYWQRVLARRKKGSNRRGVAKCLLAKWYYRAAQKRKYLLQRLTSQIALQSENQAIRICLESLDIEQMQSNHFKNINRALNATMFGEIVQMFDYKTDVYFVPKYFPSSKLCSLCGCKYQDLPLNARGWQCQSCNAVWDRDVNAAKNLLKNWLGEQPVLEAGGRPASATRRVSNL